MTKKCIAVHVAVDLLEKINEQKAKTGQGQSAIMIDLIEKGLRYSSKEKSYGRMLFFVKVRIDTSVMTEFGQKLQSGELDTSHTLMTYCVNNNPTVGLSFWYADSQEEFERIFAQHSVYYKEILEVVPVITPMDAMKLILETMAAKE